MATALRSAQFGWFLGAVAWLVSGCAAEESDPSTEVDGVSVSARQGGPLRGDAADSVAADGECDDEQPLERCDSEWGEGVRQCQAQSWSACGVVGECLPGERGELCELDGRTSRCVVSDGVWGWDGNECVTPTGVGAQGSSTPLVLSFDPAPVRFTRAPGSFDLAGLEASIATAWVAAETPWLVLDRNGNGRIDDGAELFGSMTRLPDGRRARHGFEALAVLDDNGDGRLDAHDRAWSALRLWSDRDQDREASSSELSSLEAYGVRSISLRYSVQARCVSTACERERAEIVFEREGAEQVGAIVDVHLNHL